MFRLDDLRYDDGRFARFAPRRDLPALIELYEANYVRLLNLAPDLETMLPRGGLPRGGLPGHARPSDGRGSADWDGRFAEDTLGKFTMVSRVAGAMDLHLTVIERQRFTTTVNLSYVFAYEQRDERSRASSQAAAQHEASWPGARLPLRDERGVAYAGITCVDNLDVGDGDLVLEPNARLCVYHDVRAVELLSHYRRRRVRAVYPWRRGRMPEVDRRWGANRFVGKWLKFCLHQGHLFLAGVSDRSARIDSMVREGRGQPRQRASD
ncbi:MAG: DUF1249 domain-containing protein [Gammaproteobacteria bacterium]